MQKITINVPDDCEVQIVRKKEKEEPVIRTYQDLIDNEVIIEEGYWIDEDSKICSTHCYSSMSSDKNMAASEKVAKSMLAMAMISQLIPYYGGEITAEEWRNTSITKYSLLATSNGIIKFVPLTGYHYLSFHTPEQRDEFLKYNEQLVKDYLMID